MSFFQAPGFRQAFRRRTFLEEVMWADNDLSTAIKELGHKTCVRTKIYRVPYKGGRLYEEQQVISTESGKIILKAAALTAPTGPTGPTTVAWVPQGMGWKKFYHGPMDWATLVDETRPLLDPKWFER